jgi:beta-carotene ketolase (CrtO type)
MPAVPLELSGGRDWDDVKDDYIGRVIGELDTYAPGLADSVIGQWVQSPKQLSQKSCRGNVVHVDMSISQMGPMRPTKSLAGYKTPVGGLWHTAAGAHPMGALNGWSGRTTARMIDRLMKRQKDATPPSAVPISVAPRPEPVSANGSQREPLGRSVR